MKKIKKIIVNITHKDYFYIVLTTLLTFLSWCKVLKQTFLGEGFIYYEEAFNFFPFYKGKMWEPENFARMQFDIFQIILKDKIVLYQIYMLIILILVAVCLYLLIKFITKEKISAIFGSLIFVVNYTGFFELLGNGGYQRFVQRIPNIIFTTLSLLLLYRYLYQKKIKYFLLSIIIFTIGVWGAHYSSFFLPIFLILPISTTICDKSKKTIKDYIPLIIISICYLAINLFIIDKDASTPDVSFLYFLQNTDRLLEKIFYQLPIATFQVDVIDFINKTFRSIYQFPPLRLLKILIFPSMLIYIIGGLEIYKKTKKLFPIYLSSFISMFSVFILNVWAAPFRPLESFGTDRYYMVPMYFSSICFSLIFYAALKSNKKHIIAIILVFLYFYVTNTITIHRTIDENYYKHVAMNSYIEFIKKNELNLNNDSVLYVRRFFLWPTIYIRTFYKYLPSINFQELHSGWEKDMLKNKFDPKNVYIIDYDFGGPRGAKFDKSKGKMVDYTEKFRKGEKLIFEWY